MGSGLAGPFMARPVLVRPVLAPCKPARLAPGALAGRGPATPPRLALAAIPTLLAGAAA